MLQLIIPFIAIFLFSASVALSADHCITINNESFCKQIDNEKKELQVGPITLQITDPFELFDKADDDQINTFTKISLWDRYDYPPFVKELARQNKMKPQKLIDLLAKHDTKWRALKDLEAVYPQLVSTYGQGVVEESIRRVVKLIINDIIEKIKRRV